MSRLTGKDALGLFEAYNAVYNPDIRLELEEELILQENAELWVSECIGGGVDFSEYTLDELTEAFLVDCGYLAEDAAGRTGQNFGAGARQLFGAARRAVGSAVSNVAKGALNTAGAAAQGLAGQKGGTGTISKAANAASRAITAPQRFAARAAQGFVTGQGSGPSKPAKPSPSGTTSKFAGARDAAFAKAKAIKGSPVVGSTKPDASSAAKPAAAPAARPAATAAAKPAPSAAAKPAPSAAAKPAPSAPQPKIKQDVADIKSMQAASQARQASSAPVAKPAAKPTPAATGSKKPGSIVSGFDMFDVVKGHLIDEGYADTEEAAIAIMVNMSEEWKASIINEASRRDEFTRAAIARNSGRKGGITFEPGPNWDPSANRGRGAHLNPKQKEKQRRKALAKGAANEEFELWVNALVEEGYDLSDYTWDEMYEFYLDEGEKPFPYEKVTAQQKKHTAAGRYGNMMKMGLAKRRAKEAEKTGGSQRDAGKGWYHGR
jgi:hypothetical protein